jgi:flavin reductase (DIM6/NTAB) family NADH-FMN oxidoreductase RutF
MMGIRRNARRALKRIILGPSDFPQQCVVGLNDPQSEITVWLHGLGTPLDVTSNHLMACGAPFIIGIGFEGDEKTLPTGSSRLSLRFHERGGDQQLLGEIGLRYESTLTVGPQHLCLFQIRNYRNYCLSKPRLWAHYLQYARMRHGIHHSDVPITACEVHAMIVFYICPRPVVLVSVEDGDARNMFPMNLMGPIGNGYFAFALNSTRAVAPLVQRAGRIALSTVPLEQARMVCQLGGNHKKPSIEWNELKFPTSPSSTIGVQVPEFALRVREMQVEATRRIGSHTLFFAKTIQEDRLADGLEFFVVHGIYQAWRQKLARPNIMAIPITVNAPG